MESCTDNGRLNCQYVRYFIIIKYWVKIVHANDNKYVKKVYNMLKYDFESNPDKENWCSLLYDLLCTLGFNDAWLFQDIGDSVLFLSLVKQRLKDQFIQNLNGRL